MTLSAAFAITNGGSFLFCLDYLTDSENRKALVIHGTVTISHIISLPSK